MTFPDALVQVSGVLIFIQGVALGLLVASRWRREGTRERSYKTIWKPFSVSKRRWVLQGSRLSRYGLFPRISRHTASG